MIRGLYTAASGLRTQLLRQTILANNTANALTPGYRQDRAVPESFEHLALSRFQSAGAISESTGHDLGELGRGVLLSTGTLDLREGPRLETGEAFDFAIAGDGYFVVETPEGPAYTRDGRFQSDVEGRLVTSDGRVVLGTGGPIMIGTAVPDVLPDGTVMVDTETVGQLQVVAFPADTQFEKLAGSLLRPVGEAQPVAATGQVEQGRLEGSNVSLENTQVNLLSALRAYSFARDVLRANDETLGRAVNDIARPA